MSIRFYVTNKSSTEINNSKNKFNMSNYFLDSLLLTKKEISHCISEAKKPRL